AAIDAATGVFTWTPSEAQGPGSYTFTVRITDDGGLYDEKALTITVSEVNATPVLSGVPASATIDEESPYTFTSTASDADLPANTLTFPSRRAPARATIDGASGVFTWTPSEAQGPGSYTFTVRITDDGGLYDEKSLT